MDRAHLWTRYREFGDLTAREELILHYAFLVRCVADRLGVGASAQLDRDDLISHGIIGLIDAVEKYDHVRGPRFESYAGARIRRAILDAVQCSGGLSPAMRAAADAIDRAVVELERSLGRQPTLAEVAHHSGLTAEEIENVLARLDESHALPSATPAAAEGTGNLTLMPPGGDWPAEEESAAREEQRRILIQGVAALPAEERLVLSLYYFEELTLAEIARVMSLAEARISQIHARAMMRLRAHLRTQADLFAAA